MNYTLFSENTKMADVILANVRLLFVLPHFEINLGFGEKTVKQICDEQKISIPLLLFVCNIHTYDDYCPNNNELKKIPIEGIIRYLQNSHKDFLEIRMPKIIENILNLTKICNCENKNSCHLKNQNILSGFCEKYKLEVITHFKYEEEIAFPYIIQLLNGEKTNNYKIKEYEKNHSDIDAALNDLKNIIIKYIPQDCAIEKCRDILLNLFMFEHDLSKHTLIEDKILISLVENAEKSA